MYEVVNTDRIRARLAVIATQCSNSGFVGQINLNFIGSVGLKLWCLQPRWHDLKAGR